MKVAPGDERQGAGRGACAVAIRKNGQFRAFKAMQRTSRSPGCPPRRACLPRGRDATRPLRAPLSDWVADGRGEALPTHRGVDLLRPVEAEIEAGEHARPAYSNGPTDWAPIPLELGHPFRSTGIIGARSASTLAGIGPSSPA